MTEKQGFKENTVECNKKDRRCLKAGAESYVYKKNRQSFREITSGDKEAEADKKQQRDIFLLPSVIFPNQVLHFVQD